MIEFIINILVQVILVYIVGYKIRRREDKQFMSVEDVNCLRTLCCCSVVFSHCSIDQLSFLPLGAFHVVGMALFFFFSGYGLSLNYHRYGKKLFIRKYIAKIFRLLFLFFVVCGTEALMHFDVFFGGMSYILVISGFYLVYIIGVVLINDTKLALCVIAIICSVFYPVLTQFGNAPSILGWSSQAVGFGLGILMYENKNIKLLLYSRSKILTLVASIMFIPLMYMYISNLNFEYISHKDFFMRIPLIVLSLVIIMCFLSHYEVGNGITNFIGRNSLYIFLGHGLAIQLISYLWETIFEKYLYIPIFQTTQSIIHVIFLFSIIAIVTFLLKKINDKYLLFVNRIIHR